MLNPYGSARFYESTQQAYTHLAALAAKSSRPEEAAFYGFLADRERQTEAAEISSRYRRFNGNPVARWDANLARRAGAVMLLSGALLLATLFAILPRGRSFRLKNPLGAATAAGHPIDVILMDDTSRLSRKLADSLRIFDQLRFSGMRLIFVSQGIDTDSEQAKCFSPRTGLWTASISRNWRRRRTAALRGRALQGFHTGGRCFGYRSVPIEDLTRTGSYGRPQIVGVKLEVHPEQAAIVRRIFADYVLAFQSKL